MCCAVAAGLSDLPYDALTAGCTIRAELSCAFLHWCCIRAKCMMTSQTQNAKFGRLYATLHTAVRSLLVSRVANVVTVNDYVNPTMLQPGYF